MSLLLSWLVTSGIGALVLGLVAWGIGRVPSSRLFPVARGLWCAAFVRLLLPGELGSPVGASMAVGVAPLAGVEGTSAAPFVLAWAVGAVALACVLVRRRALERREWRRDVCGPVRRSTRDVARGAAARMGLRAVPELVATDGPASCAGVFRRIVAVPRRLEGSSSREDLEVVLLHEFAHARRFDGLRRLVLDALLCAFWFHPVPWLARGPLSRDAELECDRVAALHSRGGAVACRRALLDAARSWIVGGTSERALGAASFRPARSALLTRLRALDSSSLRAPFARSLTAAAAALALASVGPFARTVADEIPVLPAPGTAAFDDLEGCLRKRYAVMSALAQQRLPSSVTTGSR